VIQLQRMNFVVCRERHRVWKDRGWNETEVSERLASYDRTVDESEFETWFYEGSGFEEVCLPIAVERMPQSIRGLL
jgi:hypothetical protein